MLGTLTINNLLNYSTNTIIALPIYQAYSIVQIPNNIANNLDDNIDLVNYLLTENFYFINRISNNILGKIYFTLSNDKSNSMDLKHFNITSNNKIVYNKYCKMLLKKSSNMMSNLTNDYIIEKDTYNNNNILSPAFSHLNVYVEKNISEINYNNIKKLNKFFNFDQLIVNNYAFVNKLKHNFIYAPYGGTIVSYATSPNCIYIKFTNNYYVPNNYIERSFREITFGHRDTHDVFTDARYAPQPQINFEFYLIVVSKYPNAIKYINLQKRIKKGQLLFKTNLSENNEIDVITIFNRHIKFNLNIVNYLSQDITCLIKDHDIIGEIL